MPEFVPLAGRSREDQAGTSVPRGLDAEQRTEEVSQAARDHVLLRDGEPPLLPPLAHLPHEGKHHVVDHLPRREHGGELPELPVERDEVVAVDRVEQSRGGRPRRPCRPGRAAPVRPRAASRVRAPRGSRCGRWRARARRAAGAASASGDRRRRRRGPFRRGPARPRRSAAPRRAACRSGIPVRRETTRIGYLPLLVFVEAASIHCLYGNPNRSCKPFVSPLIHDRSVASV